MAANDPNLDSLVDEALANPASEDVNLFGFLGRAKDKGKYRLYSSPSNRSSYVEFDHQDAKSFRKTDDGSVSVTLDAAAKVRHVTGDNQTEARFLRGQVTQALSQHEAPAFSHESMAAQAGGLTTGGTRCPTCRADCVSTGSCLNTAFCGVTPAYVAEAQRAGVTIAPTNCGPARTHCSTCVPGCGAHTGLCGVTASTACNAYTNLC